MSTVRAITKSQADVLLEFASKDERRTVLYQNVLLGETNDHKPVFVSTDGRRIVVMDVPMIDASGYPKTEFNMQDTGASAILPGEFLKKAVRNLPARTTINALKFAPIIVGEKVNNAATSVARKIASPIKTPSGEMVVQDVSVDGTFPRFQDVIPDLNDRNHYQIMLTLDARILAGAAKALAKYAKDNGCTYVQMYVPSTYNTPVVFKVPSSDCCTGVTVAFMPNSGDTEYSEVQKLLEKLAYLVVLLVKGTLTDDEKRTVEQIIKDAVFNGEAGGNDYCHRCLEPLPEKRNE